MIFKVPQQEHRKFNYQPRYYRPVKPDTEKTASDADGEKTAMRNRIREEMARQQKHQRVPSSRLMLYVALLFVLLWIMLSVL